MKSNGITSEYTTGILTLYAFHLSLYTQSNSLTDIFICLPNKYDQFKTTELSRSVC